ncbi:ThuA domain-containing protein [Arthrobacter sp. Soil764]|uniref:ThuA domain-containing protein n=1 Tax=Arthrobacter sp. Soil764 TaxID=1736403 RepID=UPI0006F691B5|nr:ThuA domain-containing protein [Arthrobacter sp. Soil764]KRE91088.1 hypothetical protein ASG86_16650 [Arthrobacter sp. Soil764]
MTAPLGGGPTALLLTGEGRYADPWHPFADTSHALAGLLREAGFDVGISGDVDEALADLGHADAAGLPSLLAVNVGLPRDGRPSPGTPEASAGLARWLGSDRPLLVAHSSSTSFVDLPAWEDGMGGRWVRGTSMHPDYGPAAVHLLQGSGPVVSGIPDFVLPDERYSYLRTGPNIAVHATHRHDGRDHPLMWSLQRGIGTGARAGRTFYDALGHDAASYRSPEHRAILLRAIAWLGGN